MGLGISPLMILCSRAFSKSGSGIGTASNNGRMLAETDAANPVVASLSNIAHLVTGRGMVKEKPKGDWSANEAADFAKHCVL